LRDTKRVGDLSELIVALRLAQAGYVVSKPYGENCRYDLLIDDGEIISRVQVKTGRLRKGVIEFHTYSTHSHRKGAFCKPYTNQIDFFGVYAPDLDSAYLLPIPDTAPLSGSLRVYPTKNRQHAHIRWAHQYVIGGDPRPRLELVTLGNEVIDEATSSSAPTPSPSIDNALQ